MQKNPKSLVYYFFEHRNLSKGVKAGIRAVYKFLKKYKLFISCNSERIIKLIFINYQLRDNFKTFFKHKINEESGYLFLWNKERRVPKIKISNNKQEENVLINK